MKVCILSMQHVNNFGSLLQSYSLMKILKSLGHEVHFIDIEVSEQDNALRSGRKEVYEEDLDKYSNNVFVRLIKKTDKYFFRRIVNRLKYEKQNKRFAIFRTQQLEIDKKWNFEKYDFCVIGSDEVFNCVQDTKWGFTSQLYGNVQQANKVITYAASCGSASLGNVPQPVLDKIRQTFSHVSAFSVRDNNTHEFVAKLIDNKKVIVDSLDPVLIADFNAEIQKYGKNIVLPRHYCLIYAYSDRIHQSNDINAILKFCKLKNLKPIAMGMPQQWVKNYIIADPFELLSAFIHADFVISDTFHGPIFSYKYSTRFAIIKRASNANKLGDLIKRLGISNHLLSNFDQLNSIYDIVKNQNIFADIINKGRRDAIEYLQRNIH